MLAAIPDPNAGASTAAPVPPAQPAPRKKPPIVLFVVLGVVVACGLCSCLGVGAYVLLSPNPDPEFPRRQQTSADDDVIAGAEAIARGCERFAGDNGYGPGVDDVSPYGAVAGYMDSWPENAFAGGPMQQGNEPGDFVFHTATSMGYGDEYLGYVDAVLADGSTYSVEFSY